MEILTDIRSMARKNAEKMESVDKRYAKQRFYKNSDSKNIEQSFDNYRRCSGNYEENSFSIRMIVVMLLLAVTMFLKQEQVLNDNKAYQSVMAEIHRQVTMEDVSEAVETISRWHN